MPFVKANGVNIHYEVAGRGKPIICLHGVLGSGRSWKHLMADLPDYSVYALDFRGFGDSDKPRHGYSVETFAADLEAFVDRLGLERATLIGHSLGVFVAIAFACKFPERVERLVLVGNAAHVPRRLRIRVTSLASPLLFLLGDFALRTIVRRLFFYRITDDIRDDFAEFCSECRKATLRSQVGSLWAGIGLDLRGELSRLDIPVLAIFSENDRLVPPSHAQIMEELIPSGEVRIMSGVGHMPMLESPREFGALVRRFLQATEAASQESARGEGER